MAHSGLVLITDLETGMFYGYHLWAQAEVVDSIEMGQHRPQQPQARRLNNGQHVNDVASVMRLVIRCAPDLEVPKSSANAIYQDMGGRHQRDILRTLKGKYVHAAADGMAFDGVIERVTSTRDTKWDDTYNVQVEIVEVRKELGPGVELGEIFVPPEQDPSAANTQTAEAFSAEAGITLDQAQTLHAAPPGSGLYDKVSISVTDIDDIIARANKDLDAQLAVLDAYLKDKDWSMGNGSVAIGEAARDTLMPALRITAPAQQLNLTGGSYTRLKDELSVVR